MSPKDILVDRNGQTNRTAGSGGGENGMANENELSQRLLTSVRSQVKKECGISHLTIQLEASCCHLEAVHCDLERLMANHEPPFLLASELHK